MRQRVVEPVDQAGGLVGQVGVVPGQHGQLDGGLLVRPNQAQRVRQGAGGVGDDVGVPGVGLALTRVQVRDPPHRQAGQYATAIPRDRATAIANAPIEASWSTTTSTRARCCS
jgi:hypothetical protein